MKWAISIIGSFIFELDAVEQLVYKMELNINLLRSLLALLAAGMVVHSNLPWFQPSNVSRGGGNLVPSFPCPLVGLEKESHSHHGWEFIFSSIEVPRIPSPTDYLPNAGFVTGMHMKMFTHFIKTSALLTT